MGADAVSSRCYLGMGIYVDGRGAPTGHHAGRTSAWRMDKQPEGTRLDAGAKSCSMERLSRVVVAGRASSFDTRPLLLWQGIPRCHAGWTPCWVSPGKDTEHESGNRAPGTWLHIDRSIKLPSCKGSVLLPPTDLAASTTSLCRAAGAGNRKKDCWPTEGASTRQELFKGRPSCPTRGRVPLLRRCLGQPGSPLWRRAARDTWVASAPSLHLDHPAPGLRSWSPAPQGSSAFLRCLARQGAWCCWAGR